MNGRMKGVKKMNEELLTKYSIACTNLYGIVPIERVAEIYTAQNDGHVTLQQMEHFVQTSYVNRQLEENFVLINSNEFVAEATSEPDEQQTLKRQAEGKPFYVPQKEELLRYMDEEYVEETPAQCLLMEALEKEFGTAIDARQHVGQFVFNLQVSGGDFMPEMSRFVADLELPAEEAEHFIPLVVEVAETTRLWENRGHTMRELHRP